MNNDKTVPWDMDSALYQQGLILVRAWAMAAKKAGWSKEEAGQVIREATSGDFQHLIDTLRAHSHPVDKS